MSSGTSSIPTAKLGMSPKADVKVKTVLAIPAAMAATCKATPTGPRVEALCVTALIDSLIVTALLIEIKCLCG